VRRAEEAPEGTLYCRTPALHRGISPKPKAQRTRPTEKGGARLAKGGAGGGVGHEAGSLGNSPALLVGRALRSLLPSLATRDVYIPTSRGVCSRPV